MLIKAKQSWEVAQADLTPETIFRQRRKFIKQVTTGMIGVAGAGMLPGVGYAAATYPAPVNSSYPEADLGVAVTDYSIAASYNNFYEFGSSKSVARAAQKLQLDDWQIEVSGLVSSPFNISFDDLLTKVSIEERFYRHRCVEAWSMAVPWSGFPLRKLLELADPLGSAKYVEMYTAVQPDVMPGLRQIWYPWPYVEGVTMQEAAHDLAFLVTGAYGKPLAKQFGAPLRLALPWKYGFKSIKSIVQFKFTEQQPKTFWNTVGSNEYGFWANVNPEVAHPRWSQAKERDINTGDYRPTIIYNGYGDLVAQLYPSNADSSYFR